MPPAPPKMDYLSVLKIIKKSDLEKNTFATTELLGIQLDINKSQKSRNVPPQGALFTPSDVGFENL